jgi:hypothetical protein
MRKWTAATAIVAAGVGVGGTAFAGEVTGSDKGGPESDGVTGAVGNAASECSFSGLDEFNPDDPDGFGRTQNFGQLVREFGPMGGVPGQACRGNG